MDELEYQQKRSELRKKFLAKILSSDNYLLLKSYLDKVYRGEISVEVARQAILDSNRIANIADIKLQLG